MTQRTLVLGSSSASRRELLTRLQLPFISYSLEVDETPLPNESAPALVERLALLKAKATATVYPHAIIIGADQVGALEQHILGKPHTIQAAKQTLCLVSGKTVRFYTGLCVYDAATHQQQLATDVYDVRFRTLNIHDIDAYLQREQPLNCAGSFHVEGLGISLIEELRGNDYTALIGLPLIRLTGFLRSLDTEIMRAQLPPP